MKYPIICYTDSNRYKFEVEADMDCVVRATAIALGISYQLAHFAWALEGRPQKRGVPNSWYYDAVKLLGKEVLRGGITLDECLELTAKGSFIISTFSHAFAIIDGRIFDTPPRFGRDYIYNGNMMIDQIIKVR